MDDLSVDEEFELVAAQLADRMAEYLAAVREIPNVNATLKVDLWNAAIAKRDEINDLMARLAQLESSLRTRPASEASAAARTILMACKAVDWNVKADNNPRVVINRCMQQVELLEDPIRRASGCDWLRRALAFAEAGRAGPASRCITNAKQLLSER